MRGKDQYEMEKSDAGKITVTKLGVSAKQRDGFEYEFTATFLIDQKDNFATAQKDNTHLFEKAGRLQLSEKDGEKIIAWANTGEGYTPKVYKESQLPANILTAQKAEVVDLCKLIGGKSDERTPLYPAVLELVKKYAPNGNPNSISDETKLAELKAELVLLQNSQEETN
jgi:hypothetical protein